jgi:ABC-type branched-subunit amino acid transport system substrate-binding protein
MEKFKPLNFHASVSTFLEGRVSALAAKQLGWKNVALMVPNYAYGQDVGKGFKDYFLRIVPGSKIVNEQFPEFNEDQFTPFINAMVGRKPDGIITAFFGPFINPFLKQWAASGNDANIEIISGLASSPTFALVKAAGDIPRNTYGYDRGYAPLMERTTVGKAMAKVYKDKYGKQHPVVSEFAWQVLSSMQMIKGLVEKTRSVDGNDWKTAVERGDFSFQSPYNAGPTYVNPVNHMADTCASVGRLMFTAKGAYKAGYDAKSHVIGCMRTVLPMNEVRKLTNNTSANDAALKRYYSLAGKAK